MTAKTAKPSFWKHFYVWYIFIFCTEFVYMSLELLASRFLSPYFGTTLEVWTSIIGVILLASAIGNMLGSKISVMKSRDKVLFKLLLGLSVWLLIIPFLSGIGQLLSVRSSIPLTLCTSVLLFLVPGIASGCVTPVVLQLLVEESQADAGTASGRLYSVMTLGGLFGTFSTGFYFLPSLGATKFAYMCAFVALMCAAFIGCERLLPDDSKIGVRFMVWIVSVVIGTLIGFFIASSLANANVSLYDSEGLDFVTETRYGHAHVFDVESEDGTKIRYLNVDGGYESMTFLDEDLEYELGFEYADVFEKLVLDKHTDNVLCLGGGAYSIPKRLAVIDDISVDVVEIDDGITKIAKQYFGLQEAIDESDGKIGLITGDARVETRAAKRTYDIILNDTFAGDVPARTMTTVEALADIRHALRDNGLYVCNVIGKMSVKGGFLASELQTIKSCFKHVWVVSVHGFDYDVNRLDNFLVVATDDDNYVPSDDVVVIPDSEFSLDKVQVLTDDNCPVEYLVSKDRS